MSEQQEEKTFVAEERDTGQMRMVQTTKCICRVRRPVAVIYDGAVVYVCRDCGGLK